MWRAGLLAVLLLGCGAARAQQSCPWLTQGTAAALMGGSVTMSTQAANGEGSCEFAREDGSLRLKIVVGHQSMKECMAGESIAGIGEDSVYCEETAASEHRARIRGRVRSSYFLFTMTARDPKASLRSPLAQVGEEVAGNLF